LEVNNLCLPTPVGNGPHMVRLPKVRSAEWVGAKAAPEGGCQALEEVGFCGTSPAPRAKVEVG